LFTQIDKKIMNQQQKSSNRQGFSCKNYHESNLHIDLLINNIATKGPIDCYHLSRQNNMNWNLI
jgi:hypothetical protein